jgi:type II secretory pathway pseudopilin PulG
VISWWPLTWSAFRDRRRAQAGTTLVEVLVSLVIASMALALIVGTFSTGLLNASLAKRNTAVEAIVKYEIDEIGASTFSSAAAPYSECFATEDPTSPVAATSFQGSCPDGPYTLRADVTWGWRDASNTVQVWSISVSAMPSGSTVGSSVSVYKVNR